MLVKVTKKDIANGIPGRPSSCPIALALQRRYRKYFVVFGCWVAYEDNAYAALPKEVEKFIKDFDKKRPVQPFSFEIEL